MNALVFAYKPEYSSPLASSSMSLTQDNGDSDLAKSSPTRMPSSYYAAVPSSPPALHSNDMDVDDEEDEIMSRPRSISRTMSSPSSKSFSSTFSLSCGSSLSSPSPSLSSSDRMNNRHSMGSYKTLYSRRRASDKSSSAAVAALSRAARSRSGMDEQQHRRFIAKCEDRIRRSQSLRPTTRDQANKLLLQNPQQHREMFTGEWSEEENRIFISVMQHDWENMTAYLEEDFIPETDEEFWTREEEEEEIPADILEDALSQYIPAALAPPPLL